MIIKSLLDMDLYKFSMAQAVCQLFPRANVEYRFINRDNRQFPKDFDKYLRKEVVDLAKLRLQDSEHEYLKTIRYFNPVYLDFLRGYRFNPDEVYIRQDGGDLEIKVVGPWYRTVYWETILMSIISELYFEIQGHDERELCEAYKNAVEKGKFFRERGIKFADFGTRRRYSFFHHDEVLEGLGSSAEDCLVGTSNVYFSKLMKMTPIGTVAHEWFSFHAAKYGFGSANKVGLENWVKVYQGDLGIALTDTFTTKDFFRVFNKKYAKLFDGVRHDSGDPIEFMHKTVDHYKKLGIDPRSKTIVFSDGLNPEKALQIAHHCSANGIKCSFGIGTNLTNDVEGVKPLNMVIKMTSADTCGDGNWVPTIKLSDVEGKHTGDPKMIEACKVVLGV